MEKSLTSYESFRRAETIREELEQDLASLRSVWALEVDSPLPPEKVLDQIIYLLIRRGVIE